MVIIETTNLEPHIVFMVTTLIIVGTMIGLAVVYISACHIKKTTDEEYLQNIREIDIQKAILRYYDTETVHSIEENMIDGNRYDYIVTLANRNVGYVKLLTDAHDKFEVLEVEFVAHKQKGVGQDE